MKCKTGSFFISALLFIIISSGSMSELFAQQVIEGIHYHTGQPVQGYDQKRDN
jgi:hypothetical protein